MTDKTVLITGGNTSLGYECAKAIARSGQLWHIVITARDADKGRDAVSRLIAETGYPHIEMMIIDLASLASIRSFVEVFQQRTLPPLHAIVCNAGVGTGNSTQYTKDGFEMTFGVNHLGHFLLVNLLLPHLIEPARIIVVSGAHGAKTRLGLLLGNPPPLFTNADDLAHPKAEMEQTIPKLGRVRYVTSKLSNLYFTYELDRRLRASGREAIMVNALNPGVMPGTGLARDSAAFVRFIWHHIMPLLSDRVQNFNSPARAGVMLARLVTDPELRNVSSKYFLGEQHQESSEESYDRQRAMELWEASLKLVGLSHSP